MKILLVSATEAEMNCLPGNLEEISGKLEIRKLVTGPGIMNTAFALGKLLGTEKFDLAINFGVAGSFRKIIKPGSIVQVKSEQVTDMGAENGFDFLSAFEMGLFGKNEFPYTKCKMLNNSDIQSDVLKKIRAVNGITVNTVHGKLNSIQKTLNKFHPDVESMEGAAFFYACLLESIPFVEIRSVSNFVEKRDRSSWKMKEALKKLKEVTADLIADLAKQYA